LRGRALDGSQSALKNPFPCFSGQASGQARRLSRPPGSLPEERRNEMAAHVVMYAKRTCPYCHRAERLLRERGVNDLELIFIDQDPSRRPEMIERANGRTTVPQIFIGGQHVGGSDDLAALDRAGKLSPMLA